MDNGTPNDQPSGDQTPEIAPQQPNDQQPAQAESGRKFRPIWKFAAGFLGWYLVMVLLYGLMFRGTSSSTNDEGLIICTGSIFLLQVGVFIFVLLIKELRDIAWGMLSAIGVNFVVSLALGLSTNAVCFVPFFKPLY